MADLTPGRIPVAIGGTVLADGPIEDAGAAGIRIVPQDGLDTAPASGTGIAVTYNHAGFGEVDFWNLAENTSELQQGFYFYQKSQLGSFNLIATLYSDPTGATELDVHAPAFPERFLRLFVTSVASFIGAGAAPLVIDYTIGWTLAEALHQLGRVARITDSNTDVVGAVIAGGGAHAVLALAGTGGVWTVLGKIS